MHIHHVLPSDVFSPYTKEAKAHRNRDLAALEAVQAGRPRRPPPTDFGPRRSFAAALAVREDRKAGVLV